MICRITPFSFIPLIHLFSKMESESGFYHFINSWLSVPPPFSLLANRKKMIFNPLFQTLTLLSDY